MEKNFLPLNIQTSVMPFLVLMSMKTLQLLLSYGFWIIQHVV